MAARDEAAALDHIRQGNILADEILEASPAQPQPVLVRVHQDIVATPTMFV